MFLGLMMKHHLVQMMPVAVKARFWVRDRFSAGRDRSLMPARTMAHWEQLLGVCFVFPFS